MRYRPTTPDWYGDYVSLVEKTITRVGARRVCEIGAGAHPALSQDFVRAHGLQYVANDVSEEELAKAPRGYEKLAFDAAARDFEPPSTFDFVFSVAVVEHIADPEAFHKNVFAMLGAGGRAMHHFSTLYALPFVVNRVLPENVSERVVRLLTPRAHEPHSKFPALYRWCRGPLRQQIARLERVGFHVEEYIGLFGHFYYRRVPLLQRAEDRVARWLTEHPAPALTSYACVLLRKEAV